MPHTRILDREDVRRRHAAGESQRSIARSYGVTDAAVNHVIRRYEPCSSGCGREVHMDYRNRSGRCVTCFNADRATASCVRGHDFERMAWRSKGDGTLRRVCLDCERELKAAKRSVARVPCADCGELCLGRDKRFGPGPSRCRPCAQAYVAQLAKEKSAA